MGPRGDQPEEIAESEHQDTHTGELNNTSEVRVERFHQLRKHRSQSQRSYTLTERGGRRNGHGAHFPEAVPVLLILSVSFFHTICSRITYQWIMGVLRGLRNQDTVGFGR